MSKTRLETPYPFLTTKEEQIKRTSLVLAEEMLYLKFVQGIPLVGIAGGFSDVIYQKKITDYVQMKYKRRFLLEKRNISEKNLKK